jgi:hypothetical protein
MEQDAIQAMQTLLGGKAGWLPAAVAWIGTARIVAKLVSGKVQGFLDALINFTAQNESDRLAIERVLSSRTYRTVAFLIDYFLSVKLPAKKTP